MVLEIEPRTFFHVDTGRFFFLLRQDFTVNCQVVQDEFKLVTVLLQSASVLALQECATMPGFDVENFDAFL